MARFLSAVPQKAFPERYLMTLSFNGNHFLREVQTTSPDFVANGDTEAGEGERTWRRRKATKSDPRVCSSVIWCLAALLPFECKVSLPYRLMCLNLSLMGVMILRD